MEFDIAKAKPSQDADTEFVQTSEERQSLLNAMLLRESDPEHQAMVEKADTALGLIEEFKSELSRRNEQLTNAPKTGVKKNVDDAKNDVQTATQNLKDADEALKTERGDYDNKDKNLNEPTTQRPSCAGQSPAAPAPVVASSDEPAKRREKKPTIESVAMEYMRKVYKNGQFQSATKFHKHLTQVAGAADSPFEVGTGNNSRKLFCPAASSFFDPGTLSKMWAKIRAV